jgi:predicted translin family RNA/ssDNA-binding protein
MTLYDENNNPVSLDLEAVQNAIDTLSTLQENYVDSDELVSLESAEEIGEAYNLYFMLEDMCDQMDSVFESVNESFASNNKDMKAVFKEATRNIRHYTRQYRKHLILTKFNEAQQNLDEIQKILTDLKSQIKKMPASKICNASSLIVPTLVATLAVVAIPIAAKAIKSKMGEGGEIDDSEISDLEDEEFDDDDFYYGGINDFLNENKNIVVKGTIVASAAGVVTLLNSIKAWKVKAKEANRKANTGEDASREMNWCKATLLNMIAGHERALLRRRGHLQKAKSVIGGVKKFGSVHTIKRRIKQIDGQLNKNLSYDPRLKSKLTAEKRSLENQLRHLS